MNRRIAVIAVVVIAAAVGGALYFWNRGHDLPQFSGTLEANDVRVGSLVGGRVDSVFASEGDSVRVGDRLVSLDPTFAEAQVAEQQGRVAGARAQYDLVRRGPRREDVEKARVEYQNAENDRQRLEPLLQDGIVSKQQYDSAATLAASRRETYLALQRGSRPEDVAAAKAALAREEGRLRYLVREQQETQVIAPVRGVVQTLDLRTGDLIAANQTVAVVLEAGPAKVRVFVPEPKLGMIRVGQRADLFIDSYPHRAFPGRVVEVSPRAEYMPRNVQTREQRNDLVFGVKIEADPAPELKAGMAVTTVIHTNDAASARAPGGKP